MLTLGRPLVATLVDAPGEDGTMKYVVLIFLFKSFLFNPKCFTSIETNPTQQATLTVLPLGGRSGMVVSHAQASAQPVHPLGVGQLSIY